MESEAPAQEMELSSSRALDSTANNALADPSLATMAQQLDTLRQIDALSEKLQSDGKMMESLQCMEKSLILRGHCFGLDSIEVFQACKSVGEMCNFIAMACMRQESKATGADARAKEEAGFDATALELLKKAEILTERHPIVRAVTFNNMGCYFRKKGKLRTALSYVEKAIQIESQFQDGVKAADTHLNACTILSELHRHEAALRHANISVKLLLLELFGAEAQAKREAEAKAKAEGSNGGNEAGGEGEGEGDAQKSGKTKGGLPADRVAVLAIAYHNKAVQQEFLRKYADALVSYEKAVKVVSANLDEDHELMAKLSTSYNEAVAKLTPKLEKLGSLRATAKSMRGPTNRPSPLSTGELLALQRSLGLTQTQASGSSNSSSAGGGGEAEAEGEEAE